MAKSCFGHFSWIGVQSYFASREDAMSSAIKMRNRRGELVDAPSVSASDAKNGFGQMLDRVGREGRLAITKRDHPCAVLISIDEYRALVASEQPALDSLTAEFDALYARMQAPGAAAAMESAFAMTPDELGRAARQHARAAAAPQRDGPQPAVRAANAGSQHSASKPQARKPESMRAVSPAGGHGVHAIARATPRAAAAKKVRRARG
jgi:prevent-host-death family protein